MCHGQGCRYIGDGHPTFNDGILISWGRINPYEIGLMSLSPYMEMSWDLIDPGTIKINMAYIYRKNPPFM